MKKIMLGLSVLIGSCLHATEDTSVQTYFQTPNQIYLGPECFWYSGNILNKKELSSKNGLFFEGLKLGYEYRKSWAFYSGLDLALAIGRHSWTDQNERKSYTDRVGFANLDIRVGYTLAPGKVLLTPFIGLGAYAIGWQHHFIESFSYFSGGLRSSWSLNSWCGFGVNAKIFKSMDAELKYRSAGEIFKDAHRYWGGEIGLPVTFHPAKHWDVNVEPYILDLAFGQKQLIVGSRVLVGFRF